MIQVEELLSQILLEQDFRFWILAVREPDSTAIQIGDHTLAWDASDADFASAIQETTGCTQVISNKITPATLETNLVGLPESLVLPSVTPVSHYLLVPSLNIQVGGRIWNPFFDQSFNNTTPGLCFRIPALTPQTNCPIWEGQVSFQCYGGSSDPQATRLLQEALCRKLSFEATVNRSLFPGSILSCSTVSVSPPMVDESSWIFGYCIFYLRVKINQ